jgi:hypothetical protein
MAVLLPGLCTVALTRFRLTATHFLRLFRDCAVVVGLMWLSIWCLLQAGTTLPRQSAMAWKVLVWAHEVVGGLLCLCSSYSALASQGVEPVACTLLMKRSLRWKLPELYIPAAVSITAGLLLYSRVHALIHVRFRVSYGCRGQFFKLESFAGNRPELRTFSLCPPMRLRNFRSKHVPGAGLAVETVAFCARE